MIYLIVKGLWGMAKAIAMLPVELIRLVTGGKR